MISQSPKFSLLHYVFFCILLISCSDENDSNIPDVEDPKVIVHKEMVSKGLFKSDELSVFIDNMNFAESNLSLNKRTDYDSELDETTTVISITSKTEIINNVSIIEYIPKEIAANIQDIKFVTQPSKIINEDPIIMWHLEKIGDFDIDFSYKVSGNYLSTGTTLMIQDFYQGSDYAEIYYDGVTRDVNSFITEEMLSIMENNGLIIHKGYNLPVIEGFFNASPFVLKGSNIESDILGETYADFKFQLFDQDRISLEAKMNYKTGDDGSGESYQTYTLGKFPYFTTFSEVESIENGENATTVIVISGKMIFEGIFDLQVGLFMIDNKGNPSGYFIDNGKGRVFYDSDRVTKYEDSYKNSKNQERSKMFFSKNIH